MTYIFPPPLSGNPFLHNPDTSKRPDVLLDLDEAERTAFLTFGRCRHVFEETQVLVDKINMFKAESVWSRLYRRILQREGAA